VSKHLPAALVLLASLGFGAFAQSKRTASGIIYFTNNSPDNLQSFPVELLSSKKKAIATTNPDEHYRFAFTGIDAGKYLLKLTWPNHCVLWYRIDLTKKSETEVSIIMDAACAHDNGKIRDLPKR
jgi:hypothetical protein